MTEAIGAGGLGNQDPVTKPLPGASKTQERVHPREQELIDEARRAMFDESERERLQAQNEQWSIIMKKEQEKERLGPYDSANTFTPILEFDVPIPLELVDQEIIDHYTNHNIF